MNERKLFENGLKLDISTYQPMNIRMSTKGKRPLRSLTPSDKIHAIQRIHDGESKASVARDIGVPESTLRGWCKNEDKLRFMSRQSASDKLSADSLTDKLIDGSSAASALLGGPSEKRQKFDNSMPLNFSNKIKYEDVGYKRAGLDFSTNKALSDLSFNGLAPDYAAYKNAELAALNGAKNKGYGADISRQNDPSLAAISPLSSLSHLSGLTSLAHSPLAISFSELTSNLNLIAQLNPSLAAMSGLNGLASTANSLRNIKPKAQPQMHSPRGSENERQHSLSVKNWAKQKSSFSSSNDVNYNLSHGHGADNGHSKHGSKMKCPSPSLAPSLGGSIAMPAMPDDPLLYWLKSQQAMLGLNSLYPTPSTGSTSPPMRSSTPQHHNNHRSAGTPPHTPSSTPSGSLDDKNSAWFNWCKAFGASLNSLAPAHHSANSLHHHPSSTTAAIVYNGTSVAGTSGGGTTNGKTQYENILYSHLTKEPSPSANSSSSAADQLNNNEVTSNTSSAGKPEDLSAKSNSAKTPSPSQSPIQSPAQSPIASPRRSPTVRSEADTATIENAVGAKEVLDNLLYKMNNNNNNNNNNSNKSNNNNNNNINSTLSTTHLGSSGSVSDSDVSCNSDNINNNNNNNINNNNNSNKSDGEECNKYPQSNDDENIEAIDHGEKFLKWLENCSNPRVTTVQLMQLRFLITAIKSGNDQKAAAAASAKDCTPSTTTATAEDEAGGEVSPPAKTRRRK